MIGKIEVIGLPGQGKSTLVKNYFLNNPKKDNFILFKNIFFIPIYLFVWLRVLFYIKPNGLNKNKYFKFILKRGFDSFVSKKVVVDEGGLQNFLSFFDYFDSALKVKKFLFKKLLPKKVIVVQIADEEKSIQMSGSRLEKRRGLDHHKALEISAKMKTALGYLVLALKEKGVNVIFIDSFSQNSNELFNKYLNEKNN